MSELNHHCQFQNDVWNFRNNIRIAKHEPTFVGAATDFN